MSEDQTDLPQEVEEWLKKRKASSDTLQVLEKSLHDFERSYLRDKYEQSSFYKGYLAMLSPKYDPKKIKVVEDEEVVIKDEDLLFSKSSVTGCQQSENQKSTGKASETSDDNQTPPRSSKRKKN